MFVEIQGVPSRYVENSQVRCETGVHSTKPAGWLERQPESVDFRDEAEASAP